MALLTLLALLSGAVQEVAAHAWTIEPLDLPADATARCPTLTSHGGDLYAGWVEDLDGGGHRLRWVVGSQRAGRLAWPRHGTVASGDSWFVNWADVPTVHYDGERLLGAFLERLGSDTYAYGIRWTLLASRAGAGSSELDDWAEPAWLHDDSTPTEHGFVSFAALGAGRSAAFWLDGREMRSGSGVHGHGNMTLRAAVIGSNGERGPELVLDERVCECCPTAAVALSATRAAVAFRDRSTTEVRDVAVLHGDVDTGVFERSELAGDGWEIAGCPVNGPALASAGERVALAWYTAADGRSSVRLAVSNDSAKTFGQPCEVGLGNPIGRVETVFVDDDTILVVWSEHLPEQGASWMGRSFGPDLEPNEPFRIGSAKGDRKAGYAALAAYRGGAIVVWTDGRSPTGAGLRAARLGRR